MNDLNNYLINYLFDLNKIIIIFINSIILIDENYFIDLHIIR